jgi:hypothetical protein
MARLFSLHGFEEHGGQGGDVRWVEKTLVLFDLMPVEKGAAI